MEPLSRQSIAVQREHAVEEGVGLLDRQGAALLIEENRFVVQTGMRDTAAREQRCDRRHHSDEHPTDWLHGWRA